MTTIFNPSLPSVQIANNDINTHHSIHINPANNNNTSTTTPSSTTSSNLKSDSKPSFTYDLEIFNLCKQYLTVKNHHGLSLISRQKGIPPFLRFKVWPILLKYHPFVLNPFIQPDNDIINDTKDTSSINSSGNESSTSNSQDIDDDEIRFKIKKDLHKYIQRLKYSNQKHQLNDIETEILSILENSILKFTMKWGKIIKYDQSLTWIALNLAEWFPPIPKSPWVLVGRDHFTSETHSLVVNLLDDYSNYIDNIPDLKSYLDNLIYHDEKISNMSFHDVYERLVLVLLHCPEPETRKIKNKESEIDTNNNTNNEINHKNGSDINFSSSPFPTKVNKTTLPITGGTIEERVSYFIYCLRKLLPELSQYFNEEQILTKFGCLDDEWLIWWLKFCGTKVWSKYDRGRIWDYLLGWRLKNPKKSFGYYYEKLNYLNRNTLDKLGPDIFWSVSSEESNRNGKDVKKNNSFKDLIQDLDDVKLDNEDATLLTIPFCRVDPHVSLIFISLSLLKSKENILVELDQHEIRQFLSRLPSKSYKYKQKKHGSSSSSSTNSNSPISMSPVNNEELEPINNIIISNDDQKDNNHKVNFIDNIIVESGELWRKWLWSEWVDDN